MMKATTRYRTEARVDIETEGHEVTQPGRGGRTAVVTSLEAVWIQEDGGGWREPTRVEATQVDILKDGTLGEPYTRNAYRISGDVSPSRWGALSALVEATRPQVTVWTKPVGTSA